jgi:hypothetical protein
MTKLVAELVPLGGKYYGTEIVLINDETNTKAYFQVWINEISDYRPSERELRGWDEQENGPYEICDNHYETDTAYKVCLAIEKALNGLEI